MSEFLVTIENGLKYRWCHNPPQGCGHYIETREETWDGDNCKTHYTHFGEKWGSLWDGRMSGEDLHEILTKDSMIAYMRHQPHCQACLMDNNSYLFPAHYDLSRAEVEKLVEMYAANYPDDLLQPMIYVDGNSSMAIELPKTNDVTGEHCGNINMYDLECEFAICTYWPDDPEAWRDSSFETHIFDLSKPEGWQRMLATFPQRRRESGIMEGGKET